MSDLYRVVVVDDEAAMLKVFRKLLPPQEFIVETATDPRAALSQLLDQPADVAVLDLFMPELSGLDMLHTLKREGLGTEVILMTGHGGVPAAVEALRGGACDFFTKPFASLEAVVAAVRKAAERHRLAEMGRDAGIALARRGDYRDGLIGASARMHELIRMIETVGPARANILIQGESGTGKELVAQAIHARSPRQKAPFVAVNCSTLSQELLESELFGHCRGAYTGATEARRGLFEEADGGTLFLDEIGDMSPGIQVKLLRAVQEGEIRPLGQSTVVRVDVRVLAASHINLVEAKEHGAFRDDLYYRLAVITLHLPPLRERVEDVPALAQHFLRRFSGWNGKDISGFTPEALRLLVAYSWPGNVRELENAIERACVLGNGPEIQAADLPPALQPETKGGGRLLPLDFKQARALMLLDFERSYVTDLLQKTSGNLSECARISRLDRSNFRRLLHRCGVSAQAFRGEQLR